MQVKKGAVYHYITLNGRQSCVASSISNFIITSLTNARINFSRIAEFCITRLLSTFREFRHVNGAKNTSEIPHFEWRMEFSKRKKKKKNNNKIQSLVNNFGRRESEYCDMREIDLT